MVSRAIFSDFSIADGRATLTALHRLLPPWISLILVILIAWQLARIIWTLVPGPAVGDPVSLPAIAATATSTGVAASDAQAIADAHIFGIADQQSGDEAPVLTSDDNLVDTRLTNLALKGTVASDEPEFSVAIIADGNKDEKVYSVDDAITSNAKLHAIYADRVVLNENGVLTNLKLPREFADVQTAPVRRRNSSIRQSTRNTQSIQSALTQNISKLTDVIRPTPYFVNGQQSGYRVYPGRNRQQFAALGLRPGDLIKDIDGQSLTDPTQAMQIFQSLGNSDQVTVTVERNGQPETIVLKTSQLEIDDEQSE
ncbi:MAG: type II secretion system protein GspC [Gammaproteobacteria bacterium]|nr:type II secretion system protein GspC [Gammaproteobacteria bacterium]